MQVAANRRVWGKNPAVHTAAVCIKQCQGDGRKAMCLNTLPPPSFAKGVRIICGQSDWYRGFPPKITMELVGDCKRSLEGSDDVIFATECFVHHAVANGNPNPTMLHSFTQKKRFQNSCLMYPHEWPGAARECSAKRPSVPTSTWCSVVSRDHTNKVVFSCRQRLHLVLKRHKRQYRGNRTPLASLGG